MSEEQMKLYNGKATVSKIEFTDLRFTDGLTEEEAKSGFMIVIGVKPIDPNFAEATVDIEFSMRECSGKLAGRKQCDVALDNLKRQKLIDGEDVSTIMNAVGKECTIYQKASHSQKNDTTYINTYLGGGAQKISNDDVARRIAQLNGSMKKIATASPKANPFG